MGKFSEQGQPKKHKALWIAVLILSLALLIGAGVFLLPQLIDPKTDKGGVSDETTLPVPDTEEPETESTEAPTETETETEAPTEPPTEPLPDNPIDWEYYTDINDDIYAWIYIPGTGIDLPVLQPQGEEDDNFYLHKDIYRNYLFAGALYTQRKNAKDFTDPVTVIYGHNMRRADVMFTNLLYFQDKSFFEENEYFYIYTPGHILTYRVISAHNYDTRHILNSFDFSDPEDLAEYQGDVLSPRTMVANVREGATLTAEDRLVTLSTCTYVGSEKIRYLVEGVLVDDQRTN